MRHKLILIAVWLAACAPALAGSNFAVVMKKDAGVQTIAFADLLKVVKGTTRTLPDGSTPIIVIRDPSAENMRFLVQKLFGVTPGQAKQVIQKLNAESKGKPYVQVVENEEFLLKTVSSVSGAIGFIDVYSINSSVKVIKVDGKLPFDAGYALKGN